eukprot:8742192-Lingulodinium_polyedra.AAC.1
MARQRATRLALRRPLGPGGARQAERTSWRKPPIGRTPQGAVRRRRLYLSSGVWAHAPCTPGIRTQARSPRRRLCPYGAT